MTRAKKLINYCLSSHRSFVTSMQITAGILLSIFSLLFFLEFAHKLFENDLLSFDISLSQRVFALRTPVFTQVMKFFSLIGGDGTLVIATMTTIILLLRKHKKEAVLFSLTLAIGTLLNFAFKSIAQRPRPLLSPLVPASYYSFPSGHAMNAFIFFTLFAYFSYHFFRRRTLSILISVMSCVMILCIGFSRIYLGVHYPTDVIAGYIAGFWWFVTALMIEHSLIFYRLFKKSE